MNTQRPEWNDANNALVGNGVSMVTLYYMRRFMAFFQGILEPLDTKAFLVSSELFDFYTLVHKTLLQHESLLGAVLDDSQRRTVLNGLGQAGSAYRDRVYDQAFSGEKKAISLESLKDWTSTTLRYLEHSIRANRREDHMYHAYNLMSVEGDTGISISYLDEMLEGQVAVLSSNYLDAEESLRVLDGMRSSPLFRPDQYSYLLYPNKDLLKFWERNRIPEARIAQSALLKEFLERGHSHIIVKDRDGGLHFNGNFRNAADLESALEALPNEAYDHLNKDEIDKALALFEEVFNHKAFTGRSGTFFGYEGLGSIYWHMVSKLLYAVQEICLRAIESGADEAVIGRLLDHYYEINEGIGVHKPPSLYGAFPTDPYSHTPMGKGAQQPGMTGQVKEDILSRFGELGVFIENGQLAFKPHLLRKIEFLEEATAFTYLDVQGAPQEVQLEKGTLFFTVCQVPVVYNLADQDEMKLHFKDGKEGIVEELKLDRVHTSDIFQRKGSIVRIDIGINALQLK